MEQEKLDREILELLCRNARQDDAEIALQLGVPAETVTAAISRMEADGRILGYAAVTREVASHAGNVVALIEVQVQPERDLGFDRVASELARFPEVRSVHLVSGHYDLLLEVAGKTLQDVALFVASRLASVDGVKSTSTLFMLKKYKDAGIVVDKEERDVRLKVTP